MQAWTSGHLIPAAPPPPPHPHAFPSPWEPGTSIPDCIVGWGRVGVLGKRWVIKTQLHHTPHHLPLSKSDFTSPDSSQLFRSNSPAPLSKFQSLLGELTWSRLPRGSRPERERGCGRRELECVREFSVPQSCLTHRRSPARLLCSWDCPCKNAVVGCHFLLQEDLPDPESGRLTCPAFPALAGGFLTPEPSGKPL